MAVLAKAEQDCITELTAYMLTIITVAQDYEHPAWEHYVQAYGDKAAVNKEQEVVPNCSSTKCLLVEQNT